MNALEIRDLERRFGNRTVVRGLSLSLDTGSRVSLVGPNGSGKSTVLRCIAGSLTLNGGSISIHGHPAGSREARDSTGVSFAQERSFYLRLSAWENLAIFSRFRNDSERDAIAQVRSLEEELELGDIVRERVDRCSSGMLQQLSFARALLGKPRLLLLDEPTRSLDAQALERVWGALERRPMMAVLMATHSEEDALRCDDRVELGPDAS